MMNDMFMDAIASTTSEDIILACMDTAGMFI